LVSFASELSFTVAAKLLSLGRPFRQLPISLQHHVSFRGYQIESTNPSKDRHEARGSSGASPISQFSLIRIQIIDIIPSPIERPMAIARKMSIGALEAAPLMP
jgi:hypothetical protein